MTDDKRTSFVFEKGFFSPAPLVCVVGGLGQMGGLFASLFEKSGCHVSIIDKPNFFDENTDEEKSSAHSDQYSDHLKQSIEKISKSDIVILAASLSQMEKVVEQYVPHISKGALLLDIASVKQIFLEKMISYVRDGVEIVGAHPLFGPYPKIEGQRIVLCPVENTGIKNSKWLGIIRDFFQHHGLLQITSDARTHDENVALTQSLLHAILFSLVGVVGEKKKSMEQVLQFTTPLFKIQSDLAARLLSQKGSLYADIAFKNPYTLDAMKSFRKVFDGFIDCLEQKDALVYQKMIEKLKPTFTSLETACENSRKWVENPPCVDKKNN